MKKMEAVGSEGKQNCFGGRNPEGTAKLKALKWKQSAFEEQEGPCGMVRMLQIHEG